MDEQRRRDRLRSFAFGGVVGASAVLAAVRGRPRRQPARRRPTAAGLAAFEDAPCYRELAELERFDDEPR